MMQVAIIGIIFARTANDQASSIAIPSPVLIQLCTELIVRGDGDAVVDRYTVDVAPRRSSAFASKLNR
jgi:hypothetical protein